MLKKRSRSKLASLTALGAGAMALTAGKAEAGIIYEPLALKVGWDSSVGYTATQTVPLAGSAHLGFFISGGNTVYQGSLRANASIVRGPNFTAGSRAGSFKSAGGGDGTVDLVNAGGLWTGQGRTAGSNLIGGRRWKVLSLPNSLGTQGGSGTSNVFGNYAFSDSYALFRFQPRHSTSYLYGWVELALTMNKDTGVNPGDGPDIDVFGYAYDDTGRLIAAGETSATPEPDSYALGGLAALVLGAEGLRRQRKGRRA